MTSMNRKRPGYDGGDTSLGDPVDFGIVGSGEGGDLGGDNRGDVTEELLLLTLSHGGEEVVSESVGGVGLVVGLDLSIDSGEDVESEVVLLDGSVGETVVSDVLHE